MDERLERMQREENEKEVQHQSFFLKKTCLFRKSIDGLIGNNFRMMFFFRVGDEFFLLGDIFLR